MSGASRLGLDPNNFAAEMQQLQADLDALKNAQNAGKDIWQPKIIECLDVHGVPTVYDLVATYDPVSGNNAFRDFIATFVADNQPEAFAVPLYRVYYGAPGVLPPVSSDIAGFSYLDFDPGSNDPYKVTHAGHFGTNFYGDTNNAYLKVYFYATDTGTLTVIGNP